MSGGFRGLRERALDRVAPRLEVRAAGLAGLAHLLGAPVVLAANHASPLDAQIIAEAVAPQLRVSTLPPAVALRLGRSVVVFPERGLTPDGALGRFQDDAARVAAGRRVPVVPVAVRGSFGLDEAPSRWRVRQAPVVLVRFGAPMVDPSAGALHDAVQRLLSEDSATWWQTLSAPAHPMPEPSGWLTSWRQLSASERPGESRRPRIWS